VDSECSCLFIYRDIYQGQWVKMCSAWRGWVLPHAAPRAELVWSAVCLGVWVHERYVFSSWMAGVGMTGRGNTQLHCGKTARPYGSSWSETYYECHPVKRYLILDWNPKRMDNEVMRDFKKSVKWLKKCWGLYWNHTCDFCPLCQAEKYP